MLGILPGEFGWRWCCSFPWIMSGLSLDMIAGMSQVGCDMVTYILHIGCYNTDMLYVHSNMDSDMLQVGGGTVTDMFDISVSTILTCYMSILTWIVTCCRLVVAQLLTHYTSVLTWILTCYTSVMVHTDLWCQFCHCWTTGGKVGNVGWQSPVDGRLVSRTSLPVTATCCRSCAHLHRHRHRCCLHGYPWQTLSCGCQCPAEDRCSGVFCLSVCVVCLLFFALYFFVPSVLLLLFWVGQLLIGCSVPTISC